MDFELNLNPEGHLCLCCEEEDGQGVGVSPIRRLTAACGRSQGEGLFTLAVRTSGLTLGPGASFGRDLGRDYLRTLCCRPRHTGDMPEPGDPPGEAEREERLASAPPKAGPLRLQARSLSGWQATHTLTQSQAWAALDGV